MWHTNGIQDVRDRNGSRSSMADLMTDIKNGRRVSSEGLQNARTRGGIARRLLRRDTRPELFARSLCSYDGDKDKTIKDLTVALFERSTAHGLSNAIRAKTMLGKTTWSLLVISVFVLFVCQAAELIRQYSKRESKVNIQVRFDPKAEFPAVTFCNLNAIKKENVRLFEEFFNKIRESETSQDGVPKGGIVNIGDSDTGDDDNLFDIGLLDSPKNGTFTTEAPSNGNDPPIFTDDDEDISLNENDFKLNTTMSTSSIISNVTKMTTPKVHHINTDNEEDLNGTDVFVEAYLYQEFYYTKVVPRPEQVRMRSGHQLKDFLVHCMFKGTKCTEKDFFTFNHQKYGNCFTFNSGQHRDGQGLRNSSVQYTSRPGPRHGLSVQLYVEQDQYVPLLTPSAGVRVTVDPQHMMPFPEDDGFNVSPGFEMSVGVKKTRIIRLPLPYDGTDCVEDSALEESLLKTNAYSELYNVKYSVKGCHRTCYQYHLQSVCGCGDPEFPIARGANASEGLKAYKGRVFPACDYRNVSTAKCAAFIDEQFEKGGICSDTCPQPCSETVYSASTTTSMWPSDSFEPLLRQTLKAYSPKLKQEITNSKNPADVIRRNVVKIDVFFQELNYEKIEETPGYERENLVSDIGGSLGLWMGMSVLTLGEFLEFFIDIIKHLCRKCSSKNKENQKDSQHKTEQNTQQNRHNNPIPLADIESGA